MYDLNQRLASNLFLIGVLTVINFMWNECFSQFTVSRTSHMEDSKVIDSTVYGKWPDLSMPSISEDGKYICFIESIEATSVSTLYIKSWDLNWSTVIKNVDNSQPIFSHDSKYCIFKKAQDTLVIYDLTLKTAIYLPYTASFQISNDSKWVCCLNKKGKGIMLVHLADRARFIFPNIQYFYFNKMSTELIAIRREEEEQRSFLEKISLKTCKSSIIFKGCNIHNLVMNNDGNRLAFVNSVDTGALRVEQIFYYDLKINAVSILADNNSIKSLSNFDMCISGIDFSNNSRFIYFNLKKLNLKVRLSLVHISGFGAIVNRMRPMKIELRLIKKYIIEEFSK